MKKVLVFLEPLNNFTVITRSSRTTRIARLSFNPKTMTKTHWLLILILSLTACTEKIELPVPQAEPIPVLNSLIQPDSLITVYLSLSTPVLSDSDSEKIEEATVELFINDEYSETLTKLSDGVYQSAQAAEIGKNYRLEVTIVGYEPLRASTRIPQAPIITGGTYERRAIYVHQQSDYKDIAILNFIDPKNSVNYYQITFYEAFYKYIYETDPITGEATAVDSTHFVFVTHHLDSSHPSIMNENDIAFFPYRGATESLVFSDTLLQYENTMTFIITMSNTALLRGVSKDYYLYEKSRIRQRANLEILNYNPTNFFLVNNPVDLYSNVENGLGIFAGYSETHYELEDITDYEF